MGVSLAPVDATLAEREKLAVQRGAMVNEVVPGGPAAKAGLRGAERTVRVDGEQYAVGGDIIVAIDGQAIEEFEDLQEIVAAKKPGDVLTLDVRRNGGRDKVEVKVTLGDQPQQGLGQQRRSP
jgi:S1-C subfamily serine protease